MTARTANRWRVTPGRRVGTRAVLVLVLGLVTAGCGRGSDDTEVTVPPTSATAPVTTGTTVPATTAAPATTVVETTSTSSTTTSTTQAATTTSTTVPPGAQLVLGQDRLGTAMFGVEPEAVISYVTAVLGPPTADSGWADPNSAFGVCPGTEVRGVTWGDLLLLFSDESGVASGRRHFFSYTLGPPFGASITPAGLATPEGIAVGSTVADLKSAFPGVYVYGGDDVFGPYFVVNENLSGFLTGDTDADTVQSVIGGVTCGE
jgi:hypothetical protein